MRQTSEARGTRQMARGKKYRPLAPAPHLSPASTVGTSFADLTWEGAVCARGGQMGLQIDSRNVGMTPRWKKEIETRMATLARGYEDILHGRVTLTKNSHHKKQAHVAEALVVISLPRRRTLTARKEDTTFEEAIRAALDRKSTRL